MYALVYQIIIVIMIIFFVVENVDIILWFVQVDQNLWLNRCREPAVPVIEHVLS